MVTEHDSSSDPSCGGVLGGATTIVTRGAEAVWTAITWNSSPAAPAG
jgi:hypothetical protein